jgi:hypothetical protein
MTGMATTAGTIALAMLVTSCGLIASFDEYDKENRRSVRGTVEGLEGTTVTLLVNGSRAITVGNGPFAFTSAVRDGTSYSVTVQADPPLHACRIERGTGSIAGADVAGVAVRCPSTDATLSSLSLARGALSPSFDPARIEYAAGPFPLELLAGGPSTDIALTTSSPSARARIGNAAIPSGNVTPFALDHRGGLLELFVTAASGNERVTGVHYDVKLADYIKASNTHTSSYFGSAIALAADTLVVGAMYESSAAKGINNPGTGSGASSSGAVYVYARPPGSTWTQQAYIKASNTRPPAGYLGGAASFGTSVSLSGDTLVVGSDGESSGATGIDGDQNDTSAISAGSVYVFTRSGEVWSQQAYVKASNTRAFMFFGSSVAVSGDTMVVGAIGEASAAKTIDGNQSDTSAARSGAVYVFTRSGRTWTQTTYIKGSRTHQGATFGRSVALEGDTLVVGAPYEAAEAGAAYVFRRNGSTWSEEVHLKASNPRVGAHFGERVTLSADTLAVSATMESSRAVGVGGDQSDASMGAAGAVYVFKRRATGWAQEAYVKATNTREGAQFGSAVAALGDWLAVGARFEAGPSSGIDGDAFAGTMKQAGAVYLFQRSGGTWVPRRYVKAPHTTPDASFGTSVALSGVELAVGAVGEASKATGINGEQRDGSAPYAGAAYVY